MKTENHFEDMLRRGAVVRGNLGTFGLRSFNRMWFNYATGQFVADAGNCFMWAESTEGPWHVVEGTTSAERTAAKRMER